MIETAISEFLFPDNFRSVCNKSQLVLSHLHQGMRKFLLPKTLKIIQTYVLFLIKQAVFQTIERRNNVNISRHEVFQTSISYQLLSTENSVWCKLILLK